MRWALPFALAYVACLPGSGPPLNVYTDDAGPPPPTDLNDAGNAKKDVDLGDPFAVIGLAPARGPFTGGTRAVLRGRGFTSGMRVWIGGTELVGGAVFASDPTRAAVTVPAGNPGPADVKIRDDKTAEERVLPAGFFYESIVVEPQSGATSGGTRIAVTGRGTTWASGTQVTVDGKACTEVAIADKAHLTCLTPAGTPGAKDVTVKSTDGSSEQAREAFTYSDSPDGFRGGLSGGALTGQLRVNAFDAWTGIPLAGGRAIAGSITATITANGTALIDGPTGKVTVTVAAKCHHPISFVDVPVDTVTVYLQPVLDPACGAGDPPSNGNYGGRNAAVVAGELVWPGGVELKRADWTSVPVPQRATERRAAYVFPASGSPLDGFVLPSDTAAVLPTAEGRAGYAYELTWFPGNTTFYALAGIEDRSVTPARFVPYVMGVVRGVPLNPGVKTVGADIPMTTLLDHEVRSAPVPPAPGPRGPDRLVGQLAVTVASNAYAILPTGLRVHTLPSPQEVPFPGVPALDGTLTGESYVLNASAVTGSTWGLPASIVSRILTRDANVPVAITGFLPVPVLHEPGLGTWSGTRVRMDASGTFDLVQVVVQSSAGLVSWTIVAPGDRTSFDLPDLAALPDNMGLVRGPIHSTAYVARIDGFSYGKLRYGQLGTGSWNAYAIDSRSGAY
jgi:hypothetical protein